MIVIYPTPAEPDQLLPVETKEGIPLGIGVNPAITEAEEGEVVVDCKYKSSTLHSPVYD